MEAYICDYIRTPIGRYGGSLAPVRPDDLAAIVLKSLLARNPTVDWARVDDVILGCANQAGEDNRNVARMAALLAGLPVNVSGTTINRLCGSGMDAVLTACRQIKSGEADLVIAGGRRKYVPRSVRDAQSRHRLRPDRRNLRYNHWLAVRECPDESPVRRRFHARNRRKRSRRLQHLPRRSGFVCPAESAESRRGHCTWADSAGRLCR